MKHRRRLTAGAAATGALLLILAPFAGRAGAAEAPLAIYDSRGIGQGLVFTFAVKPSIFDPLLQFGSHYTQTTFSSQGGGLAQSLAAPAFPGTFAIGAVSGATGCGGLKGWVEARYPPTASCKTEQRDGLFSVPRSSIGEGFNQPALDDAINMILDRVQAEGGTMHVTAGLGEGTARIVTTGIGLNTDANAPVIEVGQMLVEQGGALVGSTVGHTTRITAKDVSLLGGIIHIGAITSHASASSDGVAGVADASMTFTDVNVDVGGDRHRATIDNEGVHVDDPALDRDQRLGLEEELNDALLQAGITITASTPTELTEGPSAEASVGGLVLSFRATIPSVTVPSELAGVYGDLIAQIPTRCVREITHDEPPDQLAPITDNIPEVPLCFGAGVIPGGGSAPALSLTLASAQAIAVGLPQLPGAGNGGFDPPTGTPPPVGGIDIPPAPLGPGDPLAPGSTPPTDSPESPVQRFGLVAPMPAAALLWSGAVLLVLAVGNALGPSLRHAGQR